MYKVVIHIIDVDDRERSYDKHLTYKLASARNAAEFFTFVNAFVVEREAQVLGFTDYDATVYLLDGDEAPVCCKDFSHRTTKVHHCVGWEEFAEEVPDYTLENIHFV